MPCAIRALASLDEKRFKTQCQKHKSRAVRGFEFGGPSRTRTYDQGIMSLFL